MINTCLLIPTASLKELLAAAASESLGNQRLRNACELPVAGIIRTRFAEGVPNDESR